MTSIRKIIFFPLLVIGFYSVSQDYDYNLIDKDLLIRSNAIIRNNSVKYSIEKVDKSILSVKKSITIVNQEGNKYGLSYIYYDNFREIKSISLKVFDAEGKVVERARKGNFIDIPAISSFSLFEETRIKIYSPQYKTYPYTIELEYTIEDKSLLNTPAWIPQTNFDIAVEKSDFQISFPESIPLRFKQIGDVVSSVDFVEGYHIKNWSIENLKALPTKDYEDTIQSGVYTSPSFIQLDGNIVDNNSWEDLGQWFYELNKGKDSINFNLDEIKDLTKELETDSAKVAEIYKYVQNSKRYVNIVLGIGGYQSFSAQQVHNVGYGDCKALSTYTKAVLKAVGIESNYVLIQGGTEKRKFQPDFPSNQFNHVILAVPSIADTMWLECTSTLNPPGYLGTFTDNRTGLFISDGKSEILQTPKYDVSQNKEIRSFNIDVDENGKAQIDVEVVFSGLRIERNGLIFLEGVSEDDKKTWIQNYLQLPFATIVDFNFEKRANPEICLKATIEVDNFGEKLNRQLNVGLVSLLDGGSSQMENEVGRGYEIIDSINYTFSNKFSANSNQNVNFSESNNTFSLSVKSVGNRMFIQRTFSYSGQEDKVNEEDLRNFWKRMKLQESKKFPILNKT